jgi:hypothetical protein
MPHCPNSVSHRVRGTGRAAFPQASAASKEEWKERIRTAARLELPEGHFAAQGPMKATIYYFADAPAEVEIDNIVKPIFDSVSRFIHLDDRSRD